VELNNIDELYNSVSKYLKKGNSFLIALDGADGSGKTTIANLLSSRFNLKHIELDDDRYLITNQGGYVDYIRYELLKEDLDKLKSKGQISIIEGICVLEILNRIKILPSLHIYIKKLKFGLWLDGECFDYTSSIEEQMQKDREQFKRFHEFESQMNNEQKEFNYETKGIFLDKLEYHFKFNPDQIADIVYVWDEEAA